MIHDNIQRYYELSKDNDYYSRYYVLSKLSQQVLLKKFPPKYNNVYCHHITWRGLRGTNSPEIKSAKVIGYVNKNDIEALIVSLDGNIHRDDGSLYHITISLDEAKGRKPVDSNSILKDYHKIDNPINIK